ncbi:MAG: hypothetical protein ACRDSP_22535, partial [Pseudonocardiaceae bacterium]
MTVAKLDSSRSHDRGERHSAIRVVAARLVLREEACVSTSPNPPPPRSPRFRAPGGVVLVC